MASKKNEVMYTNGYVPLDLQDFEEGETVYEYKLVRKGKVKQPAVIIDWEKK